MPGSGIFGYVMVPRWLLDRNVTLPDSRDETIFHFGHLVIISEHFCCRTRSSRTAQDPIPTTKISPMSSPYQDPSKWEVSEYDNNEIIRAKPRFTLKSKRKSFPIALIKIILSFLPPCFSNQSAYFIGGAELLFIDQFRRPSLRHTLQR